MKKFIAMMAVALVAVSASAASIDWGLSLGRTGSLSDSNGAKLTGNIYLVLSDATLDTSSQVAFEESLAVATIDTMSISAGKPVTATQTGSSALIKDGSSYNFSVVVYDSAEKLMYVASNPNSAFAYEPGVTDPNARLYFDVNMMAAPSKWTAVPEPASAMLALAGVAMLIRRRK